MTTTYHTRKELIEAVKNGDAPDGTYQIKNKHYVVRNGRVGPSNTSLAWHLYNIFEAAYYQGLTKEDTLARAATTLNFNDNNIGMEYRLWRMWAGLDISNNAINL